LWGEIAPYKEADGGVHQRTSIDEDGEGMKGELTLGMTGSQSVVVDAAARWWR